jgi:hypothetical protein
VQLQFVANLCGTRFTNRDDQADLALKLSCTLYRERYDLDRIFRYPPVAAKHDTSSSTPAACQFARLSTAVIIYISQFLQLIEVGALANTSRVNRDVATLCLTGDPSPCLRRRRHFAFYNYSWDPKRSEACVAIFNIKALFERASEARRSLCRCVPFHSCFSLRSCNRCRSICT